MSHFKRNHSRSAELFLSVTARLHWENAHRVAKSRLTPTLLPLRFYSKWLCWFPVEINSVLHLSKPSSHSATSCPSPDRWHQCTSTPDLGSTPVDREEWACILGQERLKSFIFNFPNICFYCIQELYSISGKQDKDQYTKIQGGNRSCAIFSFFRSPPKIYETEVHMLDLQIFPVHENRLQPHALKCDLAKCLLRYSVSYLGLYC